MKKIVASLLIVTVIFSCTKKAVPTTTTASKPGTETPAVGTSTAASTAEQLAAGKTLYEAKCGKCHGLHSTNEYTAVRWVGIVGWMAPKAKLSDDEKKNVLAYVQANAKQ